MLCHGTTLGTHCPFVIFRGHTFGFRGHTYLVFVGTFWREWWYADGMASRRGGRPALPEDQRRDDVFKMRTNEEERRRIQRLSAREGLSDSDVMRKALILFERSSHPKQD